MRQEIIDKMSQIVKETMTMFQSDFECDLEMLSEYEGKFIWQVAPTHTHLHLCSKEYLDKQLESEVALYDFCQGNTWADACINGSMRDDLFYRYDDETGLFEICSQQDAKAAWDISKTAALNRWQLYNQKALPTDFKVRVEFGDNEVRRYFIEQLRFARQHNDSSLLNCVKRFHNYRKVSSKQRIVISRDFSERSFLFCEDYGNGRWGLNGGIIFHGYPEEGYKENCSVQLTPSYGWSIHT